MSLDHSGKNSLAPPQASPIFALLVPCFATLSSDKRRATFRRSDVQTIPIKFQVSSSSSPGHQCLGLDPGVTL